MRKDARRKLWYAVGLIAAFVLWTVLVCFVDMQKIGPQDSSVGFGTINYFVHNLTGVHMQLYSITDWLGLVPIGVGMGFAVLGLFQWINRKKLKHVDYDIWILGGFYLAVMASYIFFEMVPVNYRPVLIEGILEVSYPSSTTMLVMCVMPTAIMQLQNRIENRYFRTIVCIGIALFIAFMVIGRLISGVHWLSDIVGGILLSAGLVMLYSCISDL